MIKLQKSDTPNVLIENAERWTQDLLACLANGEGVPKSLEQKYNHIEVKQALRDEAYSKCIYCESKISHIAHEHIEHIKPKAKDKYPQLTFEWQNLGLACPVCNNNKRDEYNEEIPFINPYIDDPSTHLIGVGHFIYHKSGDKRGELTEKQLKINRPELIERRKERIDSIRTLADKYENEKNPVLKSLLLTELKEEVKKDKEFSMCSMSMFEVLINK